MKGKFGYFLFFAFVLFVFFFFLFIMKTKAQPSSPRPYLVYIGAPTAAELGPLYATPDLDSPPAAAKPADDPSYQPRRDPVAGAYRPIPTNPYTYGQPDDIGGSAKTPVYMDEDPITIAYEHPWDGPERTPYYVSNYVPYEEGPTYYDPGYLVPQAPQSGAPTPGYPAC